MSIRLKIILLPVAVAQIVALAMGGEMFVSEQDSQGEIDDRAVDAASAWLESSVGRAPNTALAQAELIASMPAVQKAVAERDDALLEQMFAPGFEHLVAGGGVQQFQFHTPPATSLIRIHKLDSRSDDLSAFRQTVVDASTTGQSIAGLERGRFGLGARGVAVIRLEGQTVGTVEIGMDLDESFLKGLATRSGNQFELYTLPDPDIDGSDVEIGNDMRLASTTGTDAFLTQADLASVQAGGTVERNLEIGGVLHAMRALPFRDYSGKVAAIFTVSVPIQSFVEMGKSMMIRDLIAAFAALAIGTVIAVFAGRNIGGQIARLAGMTARGAERDPDLEITGTERKDEIGTMTRALAAFHENLSESERMAEKLRAEEEAERARQEAEQARAAKAEADRIEAERRELEREREVQQAKARAAEAEQAAAAERLREQEEVVNLLAAGLSALADGNLTHEIDQVLPGDNEMLRHDFNRAVAQLAGAMQKITDAAGTINGEVTAVASASDDLSRRSERNAATLEQTAAALDELTASVRSAAQSASEARRLTEDANRNADDGSDSVGQVVEAMARIEASSQGIEKSPG